MVHIARVGSVLPGLTSEPELSTGLKLVLPLVDEALVDPGVLLEHAQDFQLFGLGAVDSDPWAVLSRLAVLEPDHRCLDVVQQAGIGV